ncbi:unnamed protein product [Durusdinium trenchii]|uniref:Fucosyltransferase n=1 Tax=Durusdinium trenchii TaxID=1381693 RepID=A0ABP0MSZ8_9DINO
MVDVHWTKRSCCHLVLVLATWSIPAVVFVWSESTVPFVGLQALPGRAQSPAFLEPTVAPVAERPFIENFRPFDRSNLTTITTVSTTCSSALPSKSSVRTVYISSVYGWPTAGLLPSCPVPCHVTRDARLWRSADVIVWNLRWLTSSPQFMGATPSSKPRGQRWVANYDFEAPVHQPQRLMAELGRGIDWTAGFQTGSDFAKPHMKLAPLQEPGMVEKRNFAEGKDQLLLWFVSNCGPKDRINVFQHLASYLPASKVQRFGKCGGAFKDPCGNRFNVSCLKTSTRRFKFYAAFENTRCDGYITEKFTHGYQFGMVPIAWGGLSRADYEKVVPGSSFIHVDDFKDYKALANYLLKLDADDASYNKYFEWRTQYRMVDRDEIWDNVTCNLCMEAQKPWREQKRSRSDWNKGFFGRCKT